jgi:hypothetical protein
VNAAQSTFGGGSSDAFVTKLNATGGYVYATYLGGSEYEDETAVVVDASGNA